jgi:heat shock protein HslJ
MRVLMPRRDVALATTLLLLAACGAPESKAPPLPPVTPIMVPPAIAADSANVLAGRAWAWQGSRLADGTNVAVDAPERYTIEFMPDGRVQLRADCNRGNAGYTAGANRALSLTPAATTKMGCPPGSKDTVFLRQLAEVSGYSLVDGGLVLALKADVGSMRFAPLAR